MFIMTIIFLVISTICAFSAGGMVIGVGVLSFYIALYLMIHQISANQQAMVILQNSNFTKLKNKIIDMAK